MHQSDFAIDNNCYRVKSIRVSPDGYIYNNSIVTLTGNSNVANTTQTQQIFNNVDEQVFVADKSCFPSQLRYNYITNQTSNPLMRCGGTLIPNNSLNVKCNNWGSGFNPTTDLLPAGKYNYTPQWTFGNACNPGMLAGIAPGDLFSNINSANPLDEDYYAQLGNFTEAAFSEYSTSNHETFIHKIQNFSVDSKDDILKTRAQFISNSLLLKQGRNNELLQYYNNRLLQPENLADSIYSVIEKEKIFLMLTDTGINNASKKILECRQANIINTELLNLLYPIQKEITAVPINSSSNFILFPSPVKDVVYIKNYSQKMVQPTVSIYDISGRLLINTVPNNPDNDIHINVSSLLSGCYIIKLFEGRKLIYTSKFIKD